MKVEASYRRSRLAATLIPVVLVSLLSNVPLPASTLTVSLSALGSVAAGSTGNNFDVLLTNTSGPAVSVGGFFFEVMAASPDVTFTDATTATATSYIFTGSSLFGPDIMTTNTGQDLDASDLGNATLASGATLALGHVLFNVSPTASTEIVDLTFGAYPATSLADVSGVNLPINTLSGGQIQIMGAASTVPEPSTLALLVIATFFVWIRRSCAHFSDKTGCSGKNS